MTDAVKVFPAIEDVLPCAELGCMALFTDTVDNCKRRSCPFSFARRREAEALKDEKERMNEGT